MKITWIDIMIIAVVSVWIGYASGLFVAHRQHEAKYVCVEKNKE